MNYENRHDTIARASGGGLVAAIGLAAVLGTTVILAGTAKPSPAPTAAASPAPFDPSRFILNAMLVPALDSDVMPLRWVDPVPRSHCGPHTRVRVNRQPLAAGSLVPDTSFEIEWLADGCRPFGTSGPRFDGRVRLTVFREDGGLGAIVEPSRLRIAFAGRETILNQRSSAWLPIADEAADGHEPVAVGSGG